MGISPSGVILFGVHADEDFADWLPEDFETPPGAPVEIVMAGFHDYPQVFLALPETQVWTGGYDHEAFDFNELSKHVTADAIVDAMEYCKAHGYPDFTEPAWLLTSSLG